MKVSEQRLLKELKMINNNLPKDYYAEPVSKDNLYIWKAIIPGPKNSPFEGGKFKISLNFPNDYPWKPPKVKFITKIYHPNISENGGICLDILQSNWSPSLNIATLLLSICSLLTDPNLDHGLRPEIVNICKLNKIIYNQNARKWTELYAMGT